VHNKEHEGCQNFTVYTDVVVAATIITVTPTTSTIIIISFKLLTFMTCTLTFERPNGYVMNQQV